MRRLYWLLVFAQALARMLWRENDYYDIGKHETEAATPEQRAWLEALSEVPGVECYIWWPSDMEEITEILTGARLGSD